MSSVSARGGFFFQAEDGIRDADVTGVQTCALPIYLVGDAVEGVDVVVQVVDGAAGVGRGDAYVYKQKVAPTGAAAICVVNKLDAVRRHAEVPQLALAAELGPFEEVVPVSAATGAGVDMLRGLLVARLPEGPPLYPPEDVTDQSLETRLAELIREQALRRARDEVPHSIGVV